MERIFCILGKSASGKDKIHAALLADPSLRLSDLVLYTTRPIRKGETDGVQYHFVTEERMRELRKAGRIIEERTYETVSGPWTYATVEEDGLLAGNGRDILMIGTLEAFVNLSAHFGKERVIPVFIDVSDANLLARAIKREGKQAVPNYKEVCRRFLADSEDFSPERLAGAGIGRTFDNNGELCDCMEEVRAFILEMKGK